MMMLSRKEALDFHVDHQSRPFFNELIQFITSGPVIAMEILRDDAICEWKTLLGPANSGVARTDASGSIRALFGTDGIRNAAHGPDSLLLLPEKWSCFFLQVEVVGRQTLLNLPIVPVALLNPMLSVKDCWERS